MSALDALVSKFKHVSIAQKQVQQFQVEKEQATSAATEVLAERVSEILENAPSSGKPCERVMLMALDYSKRLKRPIHEYQLSYAEVVKPVESSLQHAGYKTFFDEDNNVFWFDWSTDDQTSEFKKHLAEIAKKKLLIQTATTTNAPTKQ